MHRVCSKSLSADVVTAFKEVFKYDDWLDERQFSVLHKIALDLLPSRDMDGELEVSTSKINDGDSEGRTPLSWAAECGNKSATKSLLDHGAKISNVDYHWDPLHYATRPKSPTCMSLLLNNGASAAATDKLNQTPLHLASANHDPVGIAPLVEHGADVNARSDVGGSPLDQALSWNNTKTAEYLISRGADPNGLCPTGTTFLIKNIDQEKHDCVSMLLKNGADPLKADSQGETPLHHLARSSDIRTIEVFVFANLRDVGFGAKNSADQTAQDIMNLREEVDVNVRCAFQRLMANLEGEISDSEYFDAEDTLPHHGEGSGPSKDRDIGSDPGNGGPASR